MNIRSFLIKHFKLTVSIMTSVLLLLLVLVGALFFSILNHKSPDLTPIYEKATLSQISSFTTLTNENKNLAPSKNEILAKRGLLFTNMSAEDINRITVTIANANLQLESYYLYGSFFSELKDPDSLTWNLFHETGKVQIGWAHDSDISYKNYANKMTKDEFYETFGTKVLAYNYYTADDFICIMQELRDSINSDMLTADFNTLIYEMECAKEDHDVGHIYNIYYILHDMDYFLLRYGPEDVGKYTIDYTTVTQYYGVLKIYDDN